MKKMLIVLLQHVLDMVLEAYLPNYYGDDRIGAFDDHFKYLSGELTETEKEYFLKFYGYEDESEVSKNLIAIATALFSDVYTVALNDLVTGTSKEWTSAYNAVEGLKKDFPQE